MDEENSTKKIKTASLVLMIFSSIFGFSNSLTAYYQMGYASMIWYIVTAILFFLPSAIMFAEYGASFKAARGGIFLGCGAPSVRNRPLSGPLFGCRPGWSGWFRPPSTSSCRFQRCCLEATRPRPGTSWASIRTKRWGSWKLPSWRSSPTCPVVGLTRSPRSPRSAGSSPWGLPQSLSWLH